MLIVADTGLALSIGFLQEKAKATAESNIGFAKSHQFFGCRSEDGQLTMAIYTMGVRRICWAASSSTDPLLKGQTEETCTGCGEELASLLYSREMTKGVHLWQCQDGRCVQRCVY